MSIVLFEEITTEQALQQLEAEGAKYTGLYVDMDDAKQRKFVKESALFINDLLKKLDRARIDKARDYKLSIESEAKSIRERLEAANEPYTLLIDAHKEKRAAILAEEKAKKDAEELAIKIAEDHDTALMMDKIRTIEAKEREQERIDNEKRIAEEAAEAARIQAEQAAQDAIDRANQEKEAAIAREEQAKQDAIDAEARRIANEAAQKLRHEQDLKDAEDLRIKALKDAAEQAKRDHADMEAQRIEEEHRVKAEEAKRASNRAHQKRINQSILSALVSIGVDDAMGKKIITACAKREIPCLTINY